MQRCLGVWRARALAFLFVALAGACSPADPYAIPDVGNALAGCSWRAESAVEPEPGFCHRLEVPAESEARVLLDDGTRSCDEIEDARGPVLVRHGQRAILFEDYLGQGKPTVVEFVMTEASGECGAELGPG